MRTFLGRIWALRRAIFFYVGLLLVGALAGQFFLGVAVPEMRPMNEPMIHRIVMIALFAFVVAAAIPFVPGAEIGFALLLVFGGQAAPLVYCGMVAALLLAFGVGRFVPLSWIAGFANWLRMPGMAARLEELGETLPDDRAEFLSARLSGRIGRLAVRNRYFLIVVPMNLPGNSVLGGGGGLAFSAGVSGLYRFWAFVACILIAVAPVPLAFAIMGGL